MAKLLLTLTVATITSIMIVGGFVLAPDAYSDKNHDDVPDECKCEKPHTLKVLFTAPATELPVPDNVSFKAEIFKKLDDKNNEEKQLGPAIALTPNDPHSPSMVQASQWGKDRLESNTAFVVYKVTDSDNIITKELVAEMEIHTSCSKPLFIGMTVFDVNDPTNGYSLEVNDGLSGNDPPMTSIPIDKPLTCEDEKKKSTGTITIRKALTNDNGGEAEFKDFTITVTNVETPEIHFVLDDLDDNPSINTIDVPAGTYTISETVADPFIGKYTTVMIAGDTGCPSMVDEVFTIKKGKTLSCIIYNDDDGTEDNGEVEPGNIFHVGTTKFDDLNGEKVGSCDIANLELPCMFESDDLINIVPDLKPGEEVGVSTLVLFSTVALGDNCDVDTELCDTTVEDPNGLALCTFVGLGTLDGPNMLKSFKFQCDALTSASGEFRISYALIETLIPPNVL